MLTGKRLRQYLAYKVLDRTMEPERKPPVKAKRAMPRRGPERNPAYLAWIRTLPCVACKREGRSEAAHVGTDGGMSQKASDLSCIPLCADCHTQSPDSYHRIAGGRRGFERRYRVNLVRLVARLNAEWRERAARDTLKQCACGVVSPPPACEMSTKGAIRPWNVVESLR